MLSRLYSFYFLLALHYSLEGSAQKIKKTSVPELLSNNSYGTTTSAYDRSKRVELIRRFMNTPDEWSTLEYNPNGSLTRYIRPLITLRSGTTDAQYTKQFSKMFLEQSHPNIQYDLIYTTRFVYDLTTQESMVKKLIQEIKNKHFFVAVRSSCQPMVHFFEIVE